MVSFHIWPLWYAGWLLEVNAKSHHTGSPAAVERGAPRTRRRFLHSLIASRASLQGRTAGRNWLVEGRELNRIQCDFNNGISLKSRPLLQVHRHSSIYAIESGPKLKTPLFFSSSTSVQNSWIPQTQRNTAVKRRKRLSYKHLYHITVQCVGCHYEEIIGWLGFCCRIRDWASCLFYAPGDEQEGGGLLPTFYWGISHLVVQQYMMSQRCLKRFESGEQMGHLQ